MNLACEHGRVSRPAEAEHEQAVVVSRQGEVLVLVRPRQFDPLAA